MKKLLVLLILSIVCFCLSAPTLAWQDPCNAIQYNYACEEYTLTGWIEYPVTFSPAPKCSGTVLLLDSDTWILLKYISYGDTILIANIPCRITNEGNLVCKVITQPEESYTFYLEKE